MTSAVCPSCGVRKGRRACPALGRSICAPCCGAKRRVEIRCPTDCPYLAAAEQHPPAAVQRRRERRARFLAPLVDGLTQDQSQVFLFVQLAIADATARSTDQLTDRDVADAATALSATFDTASKGIIYEHTATSPVAQRVAADLRAALDSLGREGRPPRDADLALVLARTERGAREAARAFGSDRAYLEVLADLFSDVRGRAGRANAAAGPETRQLIVP